MHQLKKSSSKKLVAIAVPLSNRMAFTEDERISLRHLLHYLPGYDRYFIIQEGLAPLKDYGFKLMHFNRQYFGSVQAHRKLLFSKGFYDRFAEYEFILIHHLDALVFSDQLKYWCEKNYDYIAPPWIPHKDAPYAGMSEYEGKVGNGGFSLRRIEGFLGVLKSGRLWRDPAVRIRKVLKSPGHPLRKAISVLKALRNFLPVYNGVRQELDGYSAPEDHFWSNRAIHYNPEFLIAPPEQALKFAFECVPRYCYEKNQNSLPFGCHAWERYDREFWTPFLLSDNH